MKSFLRSRSRRFGYDGWALMIDGATRVMEWTVSTTRQEVRDLLEEKPDLFMYGCKIKKVKITVEIVDDEDDSDEREETSNTRTDATETSTSAG